VNSVGYATCYGKESIDIFKTIFIDTTDFKILGYEEPDILIPLENKILLLEEFSIDSSITIASKKGKAGSMQKSEMSKIIKNFDNSIQNLDKAEFFETHQLNTETDLQFLEENLIRITEDHIVRFDKYKTRYLSLKKENPHEKNFKNDIEFGIVITDNTALNNMILRNNELHIITPFMFESFKNILRKNRYVEHVFFIVKLESKYMIYYFYNAGTNINELDKLSISKEDEYIKLKPQVMQWYVKI